MNLAVTGMCRNHHLSSSVPYECTTKPMILSILWTHDCSTRILVAAGAAGAAPHLTAVFKSSTNGIHTFRIPNIPVVTTSNGTILTMVAIAQGKLTSAHDRGPTSVLLSRSSCRSATTALPLAMG